jgi:hypothetical protein
VLLMPEFGVESVGQRRSLVKGVRVIRGFEKK